MRLTLLILFLSFTALVSAQDLYFEAPLITKAVDYTELDVKADAIIVNESDRPVEARWIREVNDITSGWASAVCDNNQCHTPPVDSADFTIPANSSVTMQVHIYPDGIPGEGQVSLRILNQANRVNNAVATFSFPMVSSSSTPFTSDVRLFPNPSSDEFKILYDEPLSSVTLTNMLGKTVRVYPSQQTSYDVSDLPNGIYLATLVGVNGRVVKTLRFSKRYMMP